MKEIILKVEGLMCGGCENRIKNALKNIKYISSIDANHKTGTVKIVFKDDIKQEEIIDKINSIGFKVIK